MCVRGIGEKEDMEAAFGNDLQCLRLVARSTVERLYEVGSPC